MELPDLYFNDLFENTSDLIYYVSGSGVIEKVNPVWLSTLGYKYDEVRGKSVYEFVSPEELSVFKAYREKIFFESITPGNAKDRKADPYPF
ncbi:MAG: PAS domain-containing protein [Daejeonella sp.]|uniref:PAS domain-containing protein n=1 Tax=unclassified Daejeonella TaxID=2805396 RepID=UPI0023EBDF40|nr:PAS domain-containing protein [Daejeonella sp. JGW-45]